jgi:hypothetical protein
MSFEIDAKDIFYLKLLKRNDANELDNLLTIQKVLENNELTAPEKVELLKTHIDDLIRVTE